MFVAKGRLKPGTANVAFSLPVESSKSTAPESSVITSPPPRSGKALTGSS